MSNSPKRYRDAETGEYVSEQTAAENPSTTVSEIVDGMDHLLRLLSANGGAILRICDLTPEEIDEATSQDRVFGEFVYEPIEE